MNVPMSRRDFLGSVAVAAVAPAIVRAQPRPEPAGPVYGRTGPRGIAPGTASRPSRGPVTLLDGRTLDAGHVTAWRIAPGKGVLLAPDGDGGWSILYAEA